MSAVRRKGKRTKTQGHRLCLKLRLDQIISTLAKSSDQVKSKSGLPGTEGQERGERIYLGVGK